MKAVFKKSMLIMVLMSFIVLPNIVNAAYYTNQNGVEMTESEYEKICSLFSENRAAIMTQNEFNTYKNANVIDSNVIYQKTVYQNDEVLYDEVVTETEYNNSPETTNSCGPITRDSDSGYYETSYKKLTVNLIDNNPFQLLANLTWKQVPVCRSYDVFAFRVQHFNYSTVIGNQYYYVGSTGTRIDYNSSSAGYKAQSNGAGFSMNLVDGDNITSYDMTITAFLTINTSSYSQAHAYTSYQHAQNDLTRAQSMSYTLDVSGMGNVVYYSDQSIWDKYDEMPGIHLKTPIA